MAMKNRMVDYLSLAARIENHREGNLIIEDTDWDMIIEALRLAEREAGRPSADDDADDDDDNGGGGKAA